jgi:dual specificity tyrosine-phosphorylation-regulated kinase 1
VCAYDQVNKTEVAIKIIKSRKPFLIQAKTEIEILNKVHSIFFQNPNPCAHSSPPYTSCCVRYLQVNDKDDGEESNIVRLLDQFMYRNHQCLVFEILSFNLYELLKNTKYVDAAISCVCVLS